ncbi:MAG: hypothetical protein K0S32_3221 [Bacteroidetes bacterium]|nr:hypothetical protein [Bacteroidota bacterium]
MKSQKPKHNNFYPLLLLILFSSFILKGQNFPYLNASNGNMDQSFTDADSNLYLYHSSRLAKFDKNLSQIWVNSYSGLNFQNILLSKTGSMYFISSGKIGKLSASGNLEWMKDFTGIMVTLSSGSYTLGNVNFHQLQLDRNDDLVLTGVASYSTFSNASFVKIDTLGNTSKIRLFRPSSTNMGSMVDAFHVINDSLGHYKIYGHGYSLPGIVSYVWNYSDAADSITSKVMVDGVPHNNSYPAVQFYKSKKGSFFYLGIKIGGSPQIYSTELHRLNPYKALWNYSLGSWAADNHFGDFDEDEKGNVYLLSKGYNMSHTNWNEGFIGVDTNGIYNSTNMQYLNGYLFSAMSPMVPTGKIHSIHNGNIFFEVGGGNMPSNPLTIGHLITPINCSLTMPQGSLGTVALPSFGKHLKTFTVSGFSIPTATSTVTSITNFSLANNYCIAVGAKEQGNSEDDEMSLYPNPSSDVFHLKNNTTSVTRVEILNVTGQLVLSTEFRNEATINLQHQAPGIYFVKINAKDKTVIKKIIRH